MDINANTSLKMRRGFWFGFRLGVLQAASLGGLPACITMAVVNNLLMAWLFCLIWIVGVIGWGYQYRFVLSANSKKLQ